MRVWSRITLNVTNEHTGSPRAEVFSIRPGVFLEVPEWAQKHPVFQAATTPYTDGSGIEREADVVVLEEDTKYLFPSTAGLTALPVSGTNVSDNPQAGKAVKGAYRKGKDFAAKPAPGATVDEQLADGPTGESDSVSEPEPVEGPAPGGGVAGESPKPASGSGPV